MGVSELWLDCNILLVGIKLKWGLDLKFWRVILMLRGEKKKRSVMCYLIDVKENFS